MKKNDNNFLAKKRNSNLIRFVVVVGVLFSVGILYLSLRNKSEHNPIAATQAEASEIPTWWYQKYFGVAVCDKSFCQPKEDSDKDKLTNAQEFYFHTNPVIADTNSNGLNDGQDVAAGFDPSKPGKVSFDEAASDDSILGESLLFDSEIKSTIQEMVDTSKITIPAAPKVVFNITQNNAQAGISEYLATLDNETAGSFSVVSLEEITARISNREDVSRFKPVLTDLLDKLKSMPVPSDALVLHGYNYVFWEMILQLVDLPAQEQLEDVNDPVGGLWYERTRTATELYRRMGIEENRLISKFKL